MSHKVLVVEDDETLRFLVSEAFSSLEMEVTTCPSADEAVSILDSGQVFALVFTDVLMPGQLNGWDLSNVIRERWPGLPVIVTSGHMRIHASQLPANMIFLPKPWSLDALSIAVQELTGKSDDI